MIETNTPDTSPPTSSEEAEREADQDASRPTGAGAKEGPENSDGRAGPYAEEPESLV